jgi:hypothetical protein
MYHELFLQGRPDLAEGIHKLGKTKSQPGQPASPSLCDALATQQYDAMPLKKDLNATVSTSSWTDAPAPVTVVAASRALFLQRTAPQDRGISNGSRPRQSHLISSGLMNFLSGNMMNGVYCDTNEDELPEIEDTSNLLVKSACDGALANFVLSDLDDPLDFRASEDPFLEDQSESDQLMATFLEPTPMSAVYSSAPLYQQACLRKQRGMST